SALSDLRFALRLIRKAPVLSIATIVTLGLGIGLNAGVFTVLSGLLLRPRVTMEPERFVHLQPDYSGTSVPRHESAALSTRDYLAVRDRATTLHPVAAWAVRNTQICTDTPFRELTMLVSCGFFDVYGLGHLERGRTFRDDECGDRQVPVAIIGEEFWTRRFDKDPGILDKPLVINGQPFTVIGVTAAGFSGRLRGDGVWIPYAWEPIATSGASMFHDPGTAWLWVEGRLKPGATRAAAVSELNVIVRQQDTLQPGRVTAVTVNNGALIHEPAVRPVAMFLIPLVLGSVGLVLLIACGNVTLLLLSRAVARQREIAIRLAIGCGRGRLAHVPDRERAARRARDAAEPLARLAGATGDASDGPDDAAVSDGSGPSGTRRARGGVARRRSDGRTRAGPRIPAAADHAAIDGRRRPPHRTPPWNS
ncbi:MAG TPA: ABC transporter permease, partial [Vicinamibacterales bacterium]|nr:ABC transporter permease [Vicinamibacterales bacterium]